jgi:predicted deacylase
MGEKLHYQKDRTGHRYVIKGEKPKFLLISGTHGDEFGVAVSAKKIVEKYFGKLPDFVFVSNASPSALSSKTRNNGEGLNLNRNFFNKTRSLEARTMMDLVANFKFDLCFDFHEDTESEDLYIYDFFGKACKDNLKAKMRKFLREVKRRGVGIRTSGNYVGGYCHEVAPEKVINKNGLFGDWSMHQKLIRRYVGIEMPSKLAQKDKDILIDKLFKLLIL